MAKRRIYTKDELEVVFNMAKCGKTHEQIARRLGITARTFYNHYSDFAEIIKKAKEVKDENDTQDVKSAFLKRCLGFQIEEKIYKKIKAEGKEDKELGELVETRIKEVLPDVTAGMFWLVNKSKGEFVSINRDQNITISNQDELIKELREFATR